MELSLKQSSFSCYEELLSQNITKEYSQESVVPDTMPDIAEIIDASALLMRRSKDISSGLVRIEANISVSILYRPEGGANACRLELGIPAELDVESDRISSGACCCARLKTGALDCRMLNPRKVSVRVELCGMLSCYDRSEKSLSSAVEKEEIPVYTRQEKVSISPVADVREKTFVLSTGFTLPQSSPGAGEILSNRVQPVIDELKFSSGKLLVKGTASYDVIYLGEDGSINTADFTAPFSQILDAPAAEGELRAQADIMLTGAYFELTAGSEGRELSVELHMLLQIVSRETMEIELLTGAYCNCRRLELDMGSCEAETQLMQTRFRGDHREQVDAMLQIDSIISSQASCGCPAVNGGQASLPVWICIIYRDTDGLLHSLKRRAEVSFELPDGDGISVQPEAAWISSISAERAPGGLELRLSACLEAEVHRSGSLEYIKGISCADEETDTSSLPSLVIVRATDKDDLWTLARENCSSVQLIRTVNGLPEQKESWERCLLIPKCL